MSILVIRATGFIGPRLSKPLAARGEDIVCMDINPGAASFADLEDQIMVMRGDLTHFPDYLRA